MKSCRRSVNVVMLAGLAATLPACMSLSGLSGSTSYACKAPEGVTCDSVAGTYANAVANNLPGQRQRGGVRAPPPSVAPAHPKAPKDASPVPIADAATAAAPLRSSARILRLWFKPWEDADHDLYDQGYVYVQVDGGQWQIEHVQRQIRDRFAPLKPPPRATTGENRDGAAPPASPRRPALPLDGAFPGTQSPATPAPRISEPTE